MDVIPEVIENADSIADQVQKDNLLSALVIIFISCTHISITIWTITSIIPTFNYIITITTFP